MACPNYEAEIRRLTPLHPEAWRNAHTGNAHTEDFVRIVAGYLHAIDPRVGLNGKRGDPRNMSDDALNVLDPDDGPGRTPDGRRCWVVDFIVGAGGPNPSVSWNAFDDPVASTGANVTPHAAVPAVPPAPPPQTHLHPGREEMIRAGEWLDGYYRSREGLQRAAGLSKNGGPDWEGVGAWLFDVYFMARVNGRTPEQARAAVVAALRQTDEWKSKHPGEAP